MKQIKKQIAKLSPFKHQIDAYGYCTHKNGPEWVKKTVDELVERYMVLEKEQTFLEIV